MDKKLAMLRKYFEDNGITQVEIANRLGVDKTYVNQLMTGKKNFGKRVAKQWSDLFGLSFTWLLTGEGEMEVSPSPPIEMTAAPTGTPVYDVDSTMGSDSRPMEFLQEHVIGYVNMPSISKNAAIIRANGDSMSPVINDGNFIAVREITDFDDIFYGQIYLVVTAQNRMVKY